jgi:hypothetical protein
MFSFLKKIFGKKPTLVVNCAHPKTTQKFDVVIFGKKIEGFKSDHYCPECLQKHLNAVSTVCAKCREPIIPGTRVARAWSGAPYPYTCLGWDCCESGALYVGIWGEGKLITLHDLDPKKYPIPGEMSPMDLLLASPHPNQVMIVNDLTADVPDIRLIDMPSKEKKNENLFDH